MPQKLEFKTKLKKIYMFSKYSYWCLGPYNFTFKMPKHLFKGDLRIIEKERAQFFFEKPTVFYPLDTQGVRNVSFSQNLLK